MLIIHLSLRPQRFLRVTKKFRLEFGLRSNFALRLKVQQTKADLIQSHSHDVNTENKDNKASLKETQLVKIKNSTDRKWASA